MPFHARFFPMLVPFFLGAGLNEKLHFHLLKFPHSKDELSSYDFISKCFSNLCDTEWQFLTRRFLHIQEVDKNTLSRFGAQVQLAFLTRDIPQLRRKHQVELAHICPLLRATHFASDFVLFDLCF